MSSWPVIPERSSSKRKAKSIFEAEKKEVDHKIQFIRKKLTYQASFDSEYIIWWKLSTRCYFPKYWLQISSSYRPSLTITFQFQASNITKRLQSSSRRRRTRINWHLRSERNYPLKWNLMLSMRGFVQSKSKRLKNDQRQQSKSLPDGHSCSYGKNPETARKAPIDNRKSSKKKKKKGH